MKLSYSLMHKSSALVVGAAMIFSAMGGALAFPQPVQAASLFSDGFESNNFNNWTSSEGVWHVENGGANSGSKKAEAKGDSGQNPDALVKNISTLGYNSVTLSYWFKIAAGLESNDHIYLEWSTNGTTWNSVVTYSDINSSNNYQFATFNLPAGAENNAGFRFRFRADIDSNGDQFWLDDASLSATAIVVNTAPTAQNAATSTPEDIAKSVTLTATDPQSNPLTYSIVANPLHGSLGSVSGNKVTYTPNPNYNGPDSFTFKANDGSLDSNTATISITVTPVNDTPVADDQNLNTLQNTPLGITLTASDVDSDPLTFFTVIGAAHGTLTGSAPSLTYSPDSSFVGLDSFTFMAGDGNATSSSATVTINVTSNPQPANEVTLRADKVICDDPADLPTVADSSMNVDGTTAANWIGEEHPSCHISEDWTFQWAPAPATADDDEGVAGEPWTEFESGIPTVISIDDLSQIHVREEASGNYIPFLGVEYQNVPEGEASASLYCHTDGLNFDNLDFIGGGDGYGTLVDGGEYYCVAFNAPVENPVDICSNFEGNQEVAPEGYQANENGTCTLIEEPKSCVMVSNETTYVGENPAVPTFVHLAWTHALDSSLAEWIWNAFLSTPSDTEDEIVTFTKTFDVIGTPSSVILDLAADNYYSVNVNGTDTCSDTSNLDNFSNPEAPCDITSLVQTGSNTITFTVNNVKGYGTDPEQNPGGLIYKITVTGADCEETTPVDVCPNLNGNQTVVPEGYYESDGGCYQEQKGEYGTILVRKIIINNNSGTAQPSDFKFSVDGGEAQNFDADGESELHVAPGTYSIAEVNILSPYFQVSAEGCSEITVGVDETATCTFTNDDGNGGSGSSNNSNSDNNDGGEVLGASAEDLPASCVPLLTDYLKFGWKNKVDQVTKLQTFLNDHEGAGLPVTGFFGPMTEGAVKAFQKKYGDDVLKPWIGHPGSNITSTETPTGFVYQTTKWKINNLFCADSETFPTVLD